MDAILLLGATGVTGQLVAELLSKRHIPFAVGGRDPAKTDAATSRLEGRTEVVTVDTLDRASVDVAVARFPAVLTCVGPYDQFGRHVVESCVEKGRIYVDVTGECSFVRWSAETFGDKAASSGARIVHSCSFESAFPDLLAAATLAADRSYRSIESVYRVPGLLVSPGTALTMALSGHRAQFLWRDGAYVTTAPLGTDIEADFVHPGDTAYFIPYPEIVFFARRYRTKYAASNFVLSRAAADLFRAAAKQPVQPVDEILAFQKKIPRRPFSRPDSARVPWTVGVRAVAEDGETTTARMRGTDPYASTALIAVETIQRLSAEPSRRAGVLSPAEAIADLPGLLSVLDAEQGIAIER